MEKYSSYKDNGVQWLGEIPSHWEVLRLGSYFSERKEKVSDKDYEPLSVTQNGIFPQLDNVAKTKDGDNRKLVRKNDFVINSRSDRKGSSGVSKYDGSVSLINIVLEPRKALEPSFCNYLLKSTEFIEEFYRNGHGIVADLWTTRYDEMKQIKVAFPPLEEQQSMASYLDKATAEIDNAIAQQQHMIDLLNERKQIIIQRAVTKGLDENVEMKDSGVDWIGDIPAHWQVKKLKYIANTNSGSTPRNISGKGSPSSNIKWVRTTDLNNDIVTDTSEYLSKQEMASASCPLLEPNTVLISMYGGSGSFGKIGILGIEATINQALCSISANDDIQPKYLFYYLQSVNKIWMKFAASSRKDPNLNQQIIRNIHIAYPQSKDEQDMVVGMLEKSIRELNNGISQYESLISTLQERKQIIISEVVTGKIKVS
jgi:type I restriction enzyme S subunit